MKFQYLYLLSHHSLESSRRHLGIHTEAKFKRSQQLRICIDPTQIYKPGWAAENWHVRAPCSDVDPSFFKPQTYRWGREQRVTLSFVSLLLVKTETQFFSSLLYGSWRLCCFGLLVWLVRKKLLKEIVGEMETRFLMIPKAICDPPSPTSPLLLHSRWSAPGNWTCHFLIRVQLSL